MLTLAKSVLVEIELKRLISALYAGNDRTFNYFENDIFIIFDPFDDDDELEEDVADDEIDGLLTCENVVDSPSNYSCIFIDNELECFHDDDDEEMIKEKYGFPNFYHKSSNTKLWWKLGDGMIYSNKMIVPKQISAIMNKCILSLGRRSYKYLVTERNI